MTPSFCLASGQPALALADYQAALSLAEANDVVEAREELEAFAAEQPETPGLEAVRALFGGWDAADVSG